MSNHFVYQFFGQVLQLREFIPGFLAFFPIRLSIHAETLYKNHDLAFFWSQELPDRLT